MRNSPRRFVLTQVRSALCWPGPKKHFERSTYIAMENLQHPESSQGLSPWVKACADLLEPPADWEPNLSSARARFEARADDRHRRRVGLKRYLLAGALAALMACIAVPSIPQTRAFAQQVGNRGWSRMEQFWYWLTLVRRPPSPLGRLPDVVNALHIRQVLNPGSPEPVSNAAEAALHAGFTPRLPDAGVLTAPPKLSVLGPMSFAAVIGAADLSSLALHNANVQASMQWDGARLTLQVGATITASWQDVSNTWCGGTAWSELTLSQCPAPVVTALPGLDTEGFPMAALQAAGLRNRDRAQQLARLPTTVPAILFGYRTPYRFVGVRAVNLRSGSATLVEEYGLDGPENGYEYSDGVLRIERITLLWSLRDRVYLLTGRTVPPADMVSPDSAAALASLIDLVNTID